ncbi:hypothetical protein ACIQVR_38390 [Streptomyces xanthochromogenes]|uniref:hypothetical protein n=1 Tax=Streptomyces xanthochromogenes TaxID=67384 RepID=UPI0038306CAE
MWARPRGIFFWLCLVIVLFTVAVKPVEFAHVITGALHDVNAFFSGLGDFLSALGTS